MCEGRAQLHAVGKERLRLGNGGGDAEPADAVAIEQGRQTGYHRIVVGVAGGVIRLLLGRAFGRNLGGWSNGRDMIVRVPDRHRRGRILRHGHARQNERG